MTADAPLSLAAVHLVADLLRELGVEERLEGAMA